MKSINKIINNFISINYAKNNFETQPEKAKKSDACISSPKYTTKYHNEILIKACLDSPEIVPELLQNPELDINFQNEHFQTALTVASRHNPQLVPELLECPDINVNLQDRLGNTALMEACVCHPEIVPLLLKKKDININIKNKYGETILGEAKKQDNGSYEILQSYIEQKEILNNIKSINKKRQHSL